VTEVPEIAREISRFTQAYAKRYAAGAFATPTAAEMMVNPPLVWDWRSGERVVISSSRLSRPSKRRDFTGAEYLIPAGAHVATHVARTDGAPLPDIDAFDALFTYPEDRELTGQLRAAGRKPLFTRVTAASEVITCWGRDSYPVQPVAAYDLATAVRLPAERSWLRANVLEEIDRVSQWDDDFPYYSDGSWSSVSLRGFYPDPRKGVKPSEMPKPWKAKHLEDLALECDWTDLGARLPATRGLVNDLCARYGWTGLERVRLLKMAARPGGARLKRHTDIGDKAAGLRSGQIARFHIPLITHPDARMTIWDLDGTSTAHHLAAGSCWYLDARKPHAVANLSPVDRVHLVVDVVADAGLRSLLGDTYRAQAPASFTGMRLA
jgi:hypothetical protein